MVQDSSGDAERRQRKKKSLLGGKNVTSTGLEDTFYKCQISHPVQSDFHVGVPPTQSHSASPSPPSSLPPLSSGGDPELSLRRCSTSDKKGRRSRRLSFIDDSCQDVLFFFLFGGDKSKA